MAGADRTCCAAAKNGSGCTRAASGRSLAGTWCGPVPSCAALPYFLPRLVASEEEDEGPPSAEHQGQRVKPWGSMFPGVCNPPVARLGPCS